MQELQNALDNYSRPRHGEVIIIKNTAIRSSIVNLDHGDRNRVGTQKNNIADNKDLWEYNIARDRVEKTRFRRKLGPEN